MTKRSRGMKNAEEENRDVRKSKKHISTYRSNFFHIRFNYDDGN